MLKRVISGLAFIVIVVGFFLLRQFVSPELFQILTCFIACVGTFEMARALKPFSIKPAFYIAVVFGALFIPVYCLFEYLVLPDNGYWVSLLFIALGLIVNFTTAFFTNAQVFTALISALPLVYPLLFVLAMAVMNDIANGFHALILTFAIAPASDTMAYFIGSLLKGPKLCPKLSPKKTWSGAIGGLFGGIIASLLAWLVFEIEVSFFSPVLLFILIGLIGSVATQTGDLFESYIKRKIGIKDMGNIMPGHGGVLDRFDGTFFVSVFMLVVFLFV